MFSQQEIDSLKAQLVNARQKHRDAKANVTDLRGRVSSCSFALSDAKRKRSRCKDETVRIERRLKEAGLSLEEIATIGIEEEIAA